MSHRIGPMVKTLARARGESVSAIAQVAGCHRNRMTDKLAGRVEFTESEIIALAAHFGVEPGHLFRDPCELLGIAPVPAAADELLTWRKWKLLSGEGQAA